MSKLFADFSTKIGSTLLVRGATPRCAAAERRRTQAAVLTDDLADAVAVADNADAGLTGADAAAEEVVAG